MSCNPMMSLFLAIVSSASLLNSSKIAFSQTSNGHGAGFAAVRGEKGGQDADGPYEVVEDWPKPLSQLPGHEGWTWGTINGIFAESPNRVFILQRGELPLLKRPVPTPVPAIGPSLSFPVAGEPFRNSGQGPVSSPPGPPGEAGAWKGKFGVDARWEHCLLVVNAAGDITEAWTQWDGLFKHPHAIFENPYDPEKSVWVVDDGRNVVYKFSNDGKKLLQTLGTPNEQGDDDKHFARPTFIAWLPDSTMFVADGYVNTRVVKFDKNGKYLLAWGQKGTPPNETRPGYFNTVHGVAADPVTRRIYVTDRQNDRTQVFDENGKFLDQWSYGTIPPADGHDRGVYFLYMAGDRHIWVSDASTSKIIEYDLQGQFMYSWGVHGDWPGAFWGVHEMSVDQDGNFYVAEVEAGRVQKFRPRKDVNRALLIEPPLILTPK
jgi:hypothetical protein